MERIIPSGFYVLRRPLLPIETILTLLDQTKSNIHLEAHLRNIFSQLHLQETIYLASPDLFSRLQDWLHHDNFSNNKKFQHTLLKYLIRACTRCTPYGTLAGSTMGGHFNQKTCIQFNENKPFTKNIRLNMACMAKISHAIAKKSNIRKQIKFYPNNTLYKIGNRYRYTFCETEEKVSNYSICSVEASTYLEQLIDVSQEGATVQQLIEILICNEISHQEAENFIFSIIEEQILVSGIRPNITGKDFLNVLINELSSLEGATDLKNNLQDVQLLLNEPVSKILKHEKIKDIIDQNFIQTDNKNLFHVDLFFNTDKNTLSNKSINALAKTFKKLLVLNQKSYNPDLENFKKKFYERYNEQEVPLLIALDSEAGIGYGERLNTESGNLPLIENLDLYYQKKSHTIEWNFWKDFILKKYSETLLHNKFELELTDQDLAFLKEQNTADITIPESFAAFGNLIAESEEAIDEGKFIFNLNIIGGPSGANLLGRFCNGDHELLEHVKENLKLENSDPNTIIAEIVHLPDEQAGDILLRPNLRQFEIPFLTNSSVNKEYQIPLQDLMVSVKHGKKVLLRSRRHNKRIIPRLTTAHNYSKGLDLYRFLCDIQYEDSMINVKWHWSILEKQCFLPRVRYKNVILSRATWTLMIEDYPEIQDNNIYQSIDKIVKSLRIPRFASIVEGDKELLIDFKNEYCLNLLKEELLKKKTLVLKEFLQQPQNCFLQDKSGKYTNEIIIPFQVENSVKKLINTQLSSQKIQRCFSPGSEWLYFKIYTGEKTADNLLKSDIKELTEQLLAEKIVDKWFFIRYSDPDYHIRLRFHGCEAEFYKVVTQRIHVTLDEYLQKGIVYKIQTDTYKREIERYGNEAMVLSENIFFHDSIATTQFLSQLEGDTNEKYRFLFAISSIDTLLNDFSFTQDAKKQFFKRLQQGYFKEFKVELHLKKKLNNQYREHIRDIEALLNTSPSLSDAKHDFGRILNKRSNHWYDTIEKSLILSSVKVNKQNLNDVIANYVHMSLNRLFISNPRLHELVIYHYLYKYYCSSIAKRKNLVKD